MPTRVALRGRWPGFRRLSSDQRGAVAPMFGVLFAFLLVPMGGAAIDLSRVLTSRADLQDGLDAAALALGKMPVDSTPEQLQAAADSWVAANHRAVADTQNLTIRVTPFYAGGGANISRLELSATGVVQSIFHANLGGVEFGQYPVGARTATSWGMPRIEVGLVLDNTGSMLEDDGSGSSTKSATLKDASKALIDTLAQAISPLGDRNGFKIGMVPFATYVNVGAGNKGSWITGTSPYANDTLVAPTDRFDLFSKLGVSWGGCVESRPMPYDVSDAAPNPGTPNSMFVPFFAPDEPDNTYDYNGATYELYYNNYLPDGVASTAPFATRQGRVEKYTGATIQKTHSTIYGTQTTNGPNKDCPAVPLIRLTTNYSAVKSAIDALAPAGNTHIPLGLVWGWHLVSPNAPFGDGVAYGTTNVRKVVILVTDGENTYFAGSANPSHAVNDDVDAAGVRTTTDNSLYTAYGYVWQNRISQSGGSFADPALAMNDRLSLLCQNMKNAKVTIYTIPLKVTDPGTKALLQGCASGSDHYLEADSGAELKAAFANIAGQISELRLAH